LLSINQVIILSKLSTLYKTEHLKVKHALVTKAQTLGEKNEIVSRLILHKIGS